MNLHINYKLVILYILIVLALFPILRYIVVFQLLNLNYLEDRFIVPRIIFSGPGLIIIGIILISNFKSSINKSLGGLSILTGIVWLIFIFKAILEEAG